MFQLVTQLDDTHQRPVAFSRRGVIARFLILVLLVAAAYLPAMRAGYIWDDDSRALERALRSLVRDVPE